MKALTFLIIVVIFNLINLTNLKAQVSEEWVARYNGPGNSTDEAYSLAVDGSGNVYVTGASTNNGSSSDFATIKYTSSGVQQWVQRYNGGGFTGATSIAVDRSGNVYVTGGRDSIGSFENDYATIKYNSSGVQQWIQIYNGGNAQSLAIDSLGNVYVTGSIGNGPDFEYATIKYSQSVGIHPISNEIPKEYMLSQNYPNPFNPVTKIKFDIPSNVKRQTSNVKLVIYDDLGKR